MKYVKRIGLIIFVIIGLFIYLLNNSDSIFASNQGDAAFMIFPEIPEDNIGSRKIGYFNLKQIPSKNKIIRIKIINPTNKKITVNTDINDAKTTSLGKTTYLNGKRKHITEGTPLISNLLTKSNSIDLLPKQEKWIRFKINFPEKKIKGKISGAIVLSSNGEMDTDIKNRYVYVIGITIQGKKLEQSDAVKLKMPKVKVCLRRNNNAIIQFNIKNLDPQFLKKARMQISLRNERFAFHKYYLDLNNMQVAPNSSFWADLKLGGQKLVAGNYKMKMTFASQQYKQVVNKKIRISKSQAKYINKNNMIYRRRLKKQALIIISIIIIFSLVTVFLFILRR